MMHKRSILTLLAAMTVSLCMAQGGGATLDFGSAKWEFGAVKEEGGKVSHDFIFTNRSTAPVVIETVEVTCGCTTTGFSRKPVMPMQTGTITITYNPEGQSGTFNKQIFVTANNASLKAILTISGSVVQRQRSAEELYPVALQDGVRIDGQSAWFRAVEMGSVRTMTIGWVNTSKSACTLDFKINPGCPYLKIYAPSVLPAGGSGQINITFDLQGQTSAWGIYNNEIRPIINGKQQAAISCAAYGTDKFPSVDPDNSPRVRIDRQYNDFQQVQRNGNPATTQFTLTNTGTKPLIIRKAVGGQGVSSSLVDGLTVAPSQCITFSVRLDPSQCTAGTFNTRLYLITNDPLRPVREIMLAAQII